MSSAPDYRKYAVLYVDDEEQTLKYFRKALEKEFQVMTATCVSDALAILERDAAKVGVLMSDQRMPGQSGVELLGRVRQKWPRIVRIMITAHSDIEGAIEAVNSGAIYKYLTKPADLRTLRDTLSGAMNLFLEQSVRDTALRERLGVLQRMIVADRVRSLAALAGGISHHLRNSMTAMTCFLEEAGPPEATPTRDSTSSYPDELWSLARKEREHLLDMVQKVGQCMIEPSCEFREEADLGRLIRSGIETAPGQLDPARVDVRIDPKLPPLKVDSARVAQLFKTLATYVARLNNGGKVTISAKPGPSLWNTAGIQVLVSGEGRQWSERDVESLFTPFAFPAHDPADLGLDMVVAFFIAYQHGGDLIVHRENASGSGFELWLPLNPSEVRRPDLQDGLMQRALGGLELRPAV